MYKEEIENKSHGGKREGAGRKPKVEEQAIAEKLSPLDEIAFEALKNGVENGEFPFVKLFMEYRFGKPKETVNVSATNKNIEMIRIVDVDGSDI